MTEKQIDELARRGKLRRLHDLESSILKPPENSHRFSLNANDSLMKACFDGNVASVRKACLRGADICHMSKCKNPLLRGHYPITVASQQGHEEVVKILLEEYNANAEAETSDGWTALLFACKEGQEETVKILLDRINNVNSVSHKNACGKTPLMWAAWNGRLEIVEQLLRKGASMEVKTRSGGTALHLAVSRGHDHVLQLLLSRGADIRHKNRSGQNVLIVASEYGFQQSAKLAHQAFIKQEDPLEKSIQESRGEYILPVNLVDNDGNTGLHLAARHGRHTVAKMLINYGIDINLRNYEGQTALIIAAKHGHANLIRYFLDCHANVDILCSRGWSALMWACAEKKIQAARLLNPDNVEASKRIANLRRARREENKDNFDQT